MKNYESVGQLSKPPLVYTAGFVFINLPNISEYIGKIQDNLRDQYPSFSKTDINVPEITQFGERKNRLTEHYALNDPDLKWGMIISDQRFIFHTLDYKNFVEFGRKLSSALSEFIKVTKLKHHSGLAYRQIDNFSLIEEENNLSDCINDKFLTLTLSDSIGRDKPSFSRQEHRYYLDNDSHLFLRTYAFDSSNGPSIPEDLFPLCMSLDRDIANRNVIEAPFMLADFEVNRILEQKSEILSPENIVSELDTFHKYSSLVFREVIKKEALNRRRH